MIEKNKGIPTTYKGVRFRSRLEAKWAAFFDIAGWSWQYEPFDLNGWIPDFALSGKNEILVEIKPITWRASVRELLTEWMPGDKEIAKVFKNAPKTDDEGRECLILGSNFLHEACSAPSGIAFGAFVYGGRKKHCDPAAIYAGYGQRFDFTASDGGWNYRIGGESDGDHHLKTAEWESVNEAWSEAGNLVQWRGQKT